MFSDLEHANKQTVSIVNNNLVLIFIAHTTNIIRLPGLHPEISYFLILQEKSKNLKNSCICLNISMIGIISTYKEIFICPA